MNAQIKVRIFETIFCGQKEDIVVYDIRYNFDNSEIFSHTKGYVNSNTAKKIAKKYSAEIIKSGKKIVPSNFNPYIPDNGIIVLYGANR